MVFCISQGACRRATSRGIRMKSCQEDRKVPKGALQNLKDGKASAARYVYGTDDSDGVSRLLKEHLRSGDFQRFCGHKVKLVM